MTTNVTTNIPGQVLRYYYYSSSIFSTCRETVLVVLPVVHKEEKHDANQEGPMTPTTVV